MSFYNVCALNENNNNKRKRMSVVSQISYSIRALSYPIDIEEKQSLYNETETIDESRFSTWYSSRTSSLDSAAEMRHNQIASSHKKIIIEQKKKQTKIALTRLKGKVEQGFTRTFKFLAPEVDSPLNIRAKKHMRKQSDYSQFNDNWTPMGGFRSP